MDIDKRLIIDDNLKLLLARIIDTYKMQSGSLFIPKHAVELWKLVICSASCGSHYKSTGGNYDG